MSLEFNSRLGKVLTIRVDQSDVHRHRDARQLPDRPLLRPNVADVHPTTRRGGRLLDRSRVHLDELFECEPLCCPTGDAVESSSLDIRTRSSWTRRVHGGNRVGIAGDSSQAEGQEEEGEDRGVERAAGAEENAHDAA